MTVASAWGKQRWRHSSKVAKSMHELSIALSIIDVAEEEMERLGATQIVSIHLRIGLLSGVGRRSLASAFELARENTPCAKSLLIFEEVPVVAYCPVCREPKPVSSMQRFHCAVCDSPVSNVVQGQELQVTALEVE
jgi:hydrogenase nickel incorporation protein HypA/HybF